MPRSNLLRQPVHDLMPNVPPVCHVSEFPGTCTIRLRPIDLEHDAPVLHDWVNQDYAEFWGMKGCTVEQLRSTYRSRIVKRPQHRLLIGTLDDSTEPLFLLEDYRPTQDSLGQHFKDARPTDRGFHLLVAPPGQRSLPVRSIGYYILTAATEYFFSDPEVRRVVAEPDLRNEKMLVLCQQVGYELGPVLHLPTKTAQIEVMTRERFATLPRRPPTRAASPVPPQRVRRLVFIGKVLRKLRLVR
jgi:hypothetical protein